MDLLTKFLRTEIISQELYEEIYEFINSYHIRNGEFEGNECIIRKMDENNFILYLEYTDMNGNREIHDAVSIYKKQLNEEIQKEALKNGLYLFREE